MSRILFVINITTAFWSDRIVTGLTIPQNVDVIKKKRVIGILSNNFKAEPRIVQGLSSIAADYEGFLIDAWGVLHDGESVYPHALDCLDILRQHDKKVVILSNAARRSEAMVEELRVHNIGPEFYHAVLSSGELTWRAIDGALKINTFSGRQGYYLGPTRSWGLLEGLALNWVDDIEEADFILNTGAPRGNPSTTIESDSLLARAAAKDLPMICANPDQVAIRGGQMGICAGSLAKRYQEMGASRIEYHGKPYPLIYTEALALLNIPASKVLAIGDAFETDIRGGQNTGLDTCLIAAGIHRDQLLPLSIASIKAKAPANAMPTYASEYLAW